MVSAGLRLTAHGGDSEPRRLSRLTLPPPQPCTAVQPPPSRDPAVHAPLAWLHTLAPLIWHIIYMQLHLLLCAAASQWEQCGPHFFLSSSHLCS